MISVMRGRPDDEWRGEQRALRLGDPVSPLCMPGGTFRLESTRQRVNASPLEQHYNGCMRALEIRRDMLGLLVLSSFATLFSTWYFPQLEIGASVYYKPLAHRCDGWTGRRECSERVGRLGLLVWASCWDSGRCKMTEAVHCGLQMGYRTRLLHAV